MIETLATVAWAVDTDCGTTDGSENNTWDCIPEENWLSFPQQSSVANVSSAKGGISQAPTHLSSSFGCLILCSIQRAEKRTDAYEATWLCPSVSTILIPGAFGESRTLEDWERPCRAEGNIGEAPQQLQWRGTQDSHRSDCPEGRAAKIRSATSSSIAQPPLHARKQECVEKLVKMLQPSRLLLCVFSSLPSSLSSPFSHLSTSITHFSVNNC